MKKYLLLLPVIALLTCSAQVPCELDPFCDDPDDPIEVPLDNGLLVLVTGGLLLALSELRKKPEEK